MRICFVASMGGHLEEIAQLKKIYNRYDSFLITEENDFQDIKIGKKIYFVPHINRKELGFIKKFIKLFFNIRDILKKEEFDYVITTGALISFPVAVIAKFSKVKIIYIESFARVHTLSVTGKLMYPIADLFIVQSTELQQKYKKVIYGGSIF